METQVTFRGTESTADLESRLEAVQSKVESAAPEARFAKYVVEATPTSHAVGLVIAYDDGDTWVRHAEGSDWEGAFLEIERRLDRLTEGD